MKKSVWVMGGLIVLLACFFAWVVTAMDYGDSAAVGTYNFERNEEASTLVLSRDHTFRQTLRRGGNEEHSEGTWRHLGEGGICFSKEFLVVAGDEPGPDGTTYSDMHKAFGVFTSLHLHQGHVLWYGKNDSDISIQGTYTGGELGVTSTLVLEAGHRFQQTVSHGEITNHAIGTWSQDTYGTIWFSKEFLRTSGEPITTDESASAMNPRGSNLQIDISMSEHIAEPVFYKHFL